MAIIHPYMAHRVAANPSGRPRFAQFPSLQLAQPMQFARDDGQYSLVELVVLKELGRLARYEFATKQDYRRYPRADVTPPPSRTDEKKLAIATELFEEQQRMAQAEPIWAQASWTDRSRPKL